jgi:hypothetical protein
MCSGFQLVGGSLVLFVGKDAAYPQGVELQTNLKYSNCECEILNSPGYTCFCITKESHLYPIIDA